ncbi:chorismate mutase [compost metagenome]
MNKQESATSASELLKPYRARLDSINTQVLGLLSQRMQVCMEIARLKADQNIAMMQPAQITHVLDKVRKQSSGLGLCPAYAASLFSLIIDETCRQEDALIARSRAQGHVK